MSTWHSMHIMSFHRSLISFSFGSSDNSNFCKSGQEICIKCFAHFMSLDEVFANLHLSNHRVVSFICSFFCLFGSFFTYSDNCSSVSILACIFISDDFLRKYFHQSNWQKFIFYPDFRHLFFSN